MKQYIDKAAVVLEIRNWIQDARRRYTMSKVQFSLSDRIESLERLLSFLDNLEVKEVNLDKEYKSFVEEDPVYFKLVNGIVGKAIAKHFFELGLKAQKGEVMDEQTSVGRPRFHEGDWVIDSQSMIHQIERVVENVTTHTFGYDIVGGGYFNDSTEGVRLWNIGDAKDGDVLAAHECYVIFKEIDGLNIKCYCTYHYLGFNPSFYVDTLQNKDAFHPATKEERDILMKAITASGYTFENKELVKQKSHNQLS